MTGWRMSIYKICINITVPKVEYSYTEKNNFNYLFTDGVSNVCMWQYISMSHNIIIVHILITRCL